MRHRTTLAALAAIALLGCSVDEPINPVPSGAGQGGGHSAGAGGAGQGGQGGGIVKRVVFQRNPYGNVAETQNLLWDGDFEFSNPFADEYGWISGPPFDYSFSGTRIGPMCRSGIKCAAVPDKHALIGIGVGFASANLEASFWVHLEKGTCADVKGSVTGTIFDPNPPDPDAPLTPVSATPDEHGWCQFDTVVPARTAKASLYVENDTGGEVIVDDAVLKVAPPSAEVSSPFSPPTAAHVAAMTRAREQLAKHRGPHEKPPSLARRAYEARSRP